MHQTVLLFGPQARLAGKREVNLDLPDDADVAAVLRALADAEPSLVPSMNVSRLAINQDFADADRRIGANDELALIGLISGG